MDTTPAMHARTRRDSGFTLVELMIAVTLGLLILAALTSFFVRTSYNRSELERNSRQIENGRYAINAMRDDLMLAGYYADVSQPDSTVWKTPPACSTAVANLEWVPSQLTPGIPVPVFAYADGVGRPTGCTPNWLAGTDVFVVRRLNTESTPVGSVDPTQVYVQISECPGSPSVPGDPATTPFLVDTGANAGALTLRQRDCSTRANVWRYREQLYYVRDYSTTVGDGIPTLVRVELDGGASNAVPLVEGIEKLRIDYGIDTDNDGLPNVWKRCDTAAPCTAAEYANVMAAKVYILSRNLEPTREYTDDKSYDMGLSGAVPAANDHFKRHVYSAMMGMPNRSGPREIRPAS
jgi:type IV pilus assembly protein PilW